MRRNRVLSALAALAMQASLAVIANARQAPQALLAPGEGLLPIPLPSLQSGEAAVEQQIDALLQPFRDDATRRRLDRRALADAYGRLGQVYHAYELIEAADACYENARRLAPRDHRWPHLLGYLRQQTGRFEEAVDLYAEALRLEPQDHVVAVYLGELNLQLDRRGEARRQFEEARGRFPLSATAGLGEIALRERRFADAVRLLEEALRRAPHATRLHYSIGMAYRGLGRMQDAQAHLTQVGRGAIRAADPLVESLSALVQGSRALLNQGRVEFQSGAYEAAAAAFRRAVDAAPDSLEARTALAAALERLGDVAGALTHLGEAARRLPASAEAQRQYARALLIRGRTDAAVDVLKTAVSLDVDDEDSLLQLTILLADRQRLPDALALLDSAVQRSPNRDRTTTTLARILAASPDPALRDGVRALDLATQVYARAPSAVHGETVALALAELGRCAEAAEWLRKSIGQAIQEGDSGEIERLRRELPQYDLATCRR